MSQQNPISLGDVALVKKALRPQDAHTWNAILKLLGLPLEMTEPLTKDSTEADVEQPEKPSRVKELGDVNKQAVARTKPKPGFTPGDEIKIEPAGKAVVPPAWNDPQDIFADPSEESDHLGPTPRLFAPGQARALLTATAISLVETGELDEDRATEEIARGEPLSRIPLRLRPSSRFGVQLLVDRGPRLQPFREDQQWLIVDLLKTIGAHRVEVLRFSGFPDLAGPGTRRTWRPYKPPAAGTVVLVSTDLCLGWLGTLEHTHGLRDWIEWSRRVRSVGARPVALVPHGPKYWSEALRLSMTLVHWDRSTTVGSIRGRQTFPGVRRA